MNKEELDWTISIVETFLETHIRWIVEEEPYSTTNTPPFIFLLRGIQGPSYPKLQTLQFPNECRIDTRYFMANWHTAGFGSYMTVSTVGQAFSYYQNRTFIMRGEITLYADRTVCPQMNYNCYFYNYTNCTMNGNFIHFSPKFSQFPPNSPKL
jgi:hypothetical protein